MSPILDLDTIKQGIKLCMIHVWAGGTIWLSHSENLDESDPKSVSATRDSSTPAAMKDLASVAVSQHTLFIHRI